MDHYNFDTISFLKGINSGVGVAGSGVEMDVNALMKFTNERGSRNVSGPAKYQEKPGRCVSPKCSPRRIHQPR